MTETRLDAFVRAAGLVTPHNVMRDLSKQGMTTLTRFHCPSEASGARQGHSVFILSYPNGDFVVLAHVPQDLATPLHNALRASESSAPLRRRS